MRFHLTAPARSDRALASAGTFTIAAASQRLFAFLLLPVYTAVLSPAEYGQLSVLLAIQAAAAVTLSAGFEVTVTRGVVHLEQDPQEQQRFVRSAWTFLMAAAPAAALVLALPIVLIARGNATIDPIEAVVVLLVAAAFVAATTVPMTTLRAQQRLRDYVVISAAAGLIGTSLTVLAVVVLRWGVDGWLAASLVAWILVLFVSMWRMPWGRPSPFDRRGVRTAVLLGAPLIPHAIALWSLQLADRLVLSTFTTPAQLGVYGLAANLALPCMIAVQSLNQGFMPTYARTWDSPGSRWELRGVITSQTFIVLMIGMTTALLGPPTVGVLAPASYAGAAELVPWLALGFTFLGLYFIPMNCVTLIVGRTQVVWVLTAGAAIVGLGLIATIAPVHGLESAAMCMAVAYGVLFVAVSLYARSLHLGIPVAWPRVTAIVVLVGLSYAAISLVTASTGVLSFAERIAACCLVLVGVGAFAGLSVRRLGKSFRHSS